jgi:hypothetical protein
MALMILFSRVAQRNLTWVVDVSTGSALVGCISCEGAYSANVRALHCTKGRDGPT